MIDRIKLLLETQGMTATEFADRLGIQRSGLSHIMSGRNKASLDFVRKVLTAFPEVSPDWLIRGSGSLLRKDHASAAIGDAPATRSHSSPPGSSGLSAGRQQEMFPYSHVEQPEEQAPYERASQGKGDPEAPRREQQEVGRSREDSGENNRHSRENYAAAQRDSSSRLSEASPNVEQMVLLYSDGSFEVFKPKGAKKNVPD